MDLKDGQLLVGIKLGVDKSMERRKIIQGGMDSGYISQGRRRMNKRARHADRKTSFGELTKLSNDAERLVGDGVLMYLITMGKAIDGSHYYKNAHRDQHYRCRNI
uniref:Uncharacterized protein n=1 Tax=Oryza punctata TaxID=4537 RepID=A0A0E0MGB6_ORYPU